VELLVEGYVRFWPNSACRQFGIYKIYIPELKKDSGNEKANLQVGFFIFYEYFIICDTTFSLT
jgi:hypothetical protein